MKLLKKISVFLITAAAIVSTAKTSAYAAPVETVLTNADPVIVATGYEIVDGSVEIGQEFTIEVTIQNMNKYASAYNILIDTASEDMDLRLVDGAVNQLYIPTLAPGEVKTFQQTFKLEERYPYNSAMLTYTFYYCNENGTEYDNRTIITPVVITPCKFDLNVLSVASTATLNERSLVNVRYTNNGVNDIENIVMKIDGPVLENQKTISLGSLKANEQVMQDCYVNFTEVGSQTLTISFEYEDRNGNKFTLEPQTYTVEINQATQSAVTDDNDELSTSTIVLIGFTAAIAVILLITVITSINSKRKEYRK